ncbi:MAG: hypothetical protein ABFS86_02540 [Planctomycetota bacterium]
MSNEEALAAVLLVLENDEIAEIDFHWGNRHITPRVYRQVQEAIAAGHIEVVHADQADSSSYFSQQDRIALQHTDTESIPRRAMIVHEATHAGCDLRRWQMDVGNSESIAYLAQCIYARAQTDNPVVMRLQSSTAQNDDVFDQAWHMAEDVLERGVNRWTEDADHLLFLIEGHPWYEEEAADSAVYYGLHRLDAQVARARAATASEPAAGPSMGLHRRPAMGR